ncbi:unnamed protein product, partial [Musa banksii]
NPSASFATLPVVSWIEGLSKRAVITITVTRPPPSPLPPLLHCRLHLIGLLPRHRLLVPVINDGNLTWGGNGKTPMKPEFRISSSPGTGSFADDPCQGPVS